MGDPEDSDPSLEFLEAPDTELTDLPSGSSLATSTSQDTAAGLFGLPSSPSSGLEALESDGVPEQVFADPTTEPHDATEWLAGWSRGYADGWDNHDRALKVLCRRRGLPEDEVLALCRTVRMIAGAEDEG